MHLWLLQAAVYLCSFVQIGVSLSAVVLVACVGLMHAVVLFCSMGLI